MKTTCDKCGSTNAWYAKTVTDLVVKCLCGFHKVVFTTLKEAEISHPASAGDVKLPRANTHLRRTLMVLCCLEVGTTADVAERLRDLGCACSMSDVASYLTILRAKGLVTAPIIRRGVSGGSTWELTGDAHSLLK